MKQSLIILCLSLIIKVSNAQYFKKSLGFEFGVSPKVKNIIDSGYINPPHTNNIIVGLNLYFEHDITNTQFSYGFGFKNMMSFHGDGWTSFKNNDPLTSLPYTNKNLVNGGRKEIYTNKTSLPLMLKYTFKPKNKWTYSAAIMPVLSVYWPIMDDQEELKYYNLDNGVNFVVLTGLADYYEGEEAIFRISKPKFEGNFMFTGTRTFFKKVKISIDANLFLGTRNLGQTNLTFYPTFPALTAKIHYKQPNSYLSIGVRYHFNK